MKIKELVGLKLEDESGKPWKIAKLTYTVSVASQEEIIDVTITMEHDKPVILVEESS
jgi:hypothetical protein